MEVDKLRHELRSVESKWKAEAEDEVQEIAAGGRSFAAYFDREGEEIGESAALVQKFLDFKKSFSNAPVRTDVKDPDDALPFEAIPGDEVSEVKSRIFKVVISARQDMQTFTPLQDWTKGEIV